MIMVEEKPKQWTTTELAEVAKVNQSRIRQLLLDGTLKGYKIGRDWIIPDEEAQRWLESRGSSPA